MLFHRKKITPVAQPIPAAERKTASLSESRRNQGKKILVVDDDPVTVHALALKLSATGFFVVTATDGSQALNATRKEKPDLMLLDINFPPDVAHGGGVPWNGFLITQWLRRLDEVKDTPVILISGKQRTDYPERAVAAGATAFLHKSVDSERLLATIESALTPKIKPDTGEVAIVQSKQPAVAARAEGTQTKPAFSGPVDTGRSVQEPARFSAIDFSL